MSIAPPHVRARVRSRRVAACRARAVGLVGAMAAAMLVIAASGSAPAQLGPVSTAGEICLPTADPCVIDSAITTSPGAVLDFGDREVRLVGSGRIDAGAGNLTILCGKFTASVPGTSGIVMRGESGAETAGGLVRIEASGACSRDPSRRCLNDDQCHFERVGRLEVPIVPPAGSCSTEDATVTLATRVFGNADDPGTFIVRAGGDVRVSELITLNNTAIDDAGTVEIDTRGSITVTANISLQARFEGAGGELCLLAGGDIALSEMVDASGGDFDGGIVEIDAERDVIISDSINMNSGAGEGAGGELTVSAGRDIIISGRGPTNRTIIEADGHESSESFAGDGGTQEYLAGRDIRIGEFVRLQAIGPPPDAFGGDLLLDAGRDIVVDGDLQTRARGAFGGGGDIDITALGRLTIASTASLDLTSSSGGRLTVLVDGGMDLAGEIDVSGAGTDVSGLVDMDIGRETTITGRMVAAGAVPTIRGTNGETRVAPELIRIDACIIEIGSGGVIDNKAPLGETVMLARRSFTLAGGATLLAERDGANRVRYGAAALPPVIAGSATPLVQAELDAAIGGCSFCGDGVVTAPESCDDGNAAPSDGCDAECQSTGCIAGTPGWPGVALCDDGNDCTLDACDASSGRCVHTLDCDDGIACTADRCVQNTCVHQAADSRCSDGIDCTEDICCTAELCGLSLGCESFSITGFCDDGVICTLDRCCRAGACGEFEGCLSAADDGLCDDGEACTDDICAGAAGCSAQPNTSSCDDGVACTQGDRCRNGVCAGTPTCPDAMACNTSTGLCEEVATPGCGNGRLDPAEECDDGDDVWEIGQFCSAQCTILDCGDADDSGALSAIDALVALRTAVGLAACDACVCDVDSSGGATPVAASDALRVLRTAIGGGLALVCPPCT